MHKKIVLLSVHESVLTLCQTSCFLVLFFCFLFVVRYFKRERITTIVSKEDLRELSIECNGKEHAHLSPTTPMFNPSRGDWVT